MLNLKLMLSSNFSTSLKTYKQLVGKDVFCIMKFTANLIKKLKEKKKCSNFVVFHLFLHGFIGTDIFCNKLKKYIENLGKI